MGLPTVREEEAMTEPSALARLVEAAIEPYNYERDRHDEGIESARGSLQRHAPALAALVELQHEALERAHAHAVDMEVCWQTGCCRDQNHSAERSNANVSVCRETREALAAYASLENRIIRKE